jgi:hypothetical protein
LIDFGIEKEKIKATSMLAVFYLHTINAGCTNCMSLGNIFHQCNNLFNSDRNSIGQITIYAAIRMMKNSRRLVFQPGYSIFNKTTGRTFLQQQQNLRSHSKGVTLD